MNEKRLEINAPTIKGIDIKTVKNWLLFLKKHKNTSKTVQNNCSPKIT